MWRHIAADLDVLLGGYIRALVLLAIATTVSYSIVLSLFGLPYSLLLRPRVAPSKFIPVLGPLAAALLVVGIAGLGGYGHVLWIVAFIAAYRVFQDYILNPFLMKKSVAVPALLVLFGLLAGEELAGIAWRLPCHSFAGHGSDHDATCQTGTGGPARHSGPWSGVTRGVRRGSTKRPSLGASFSSPRRANEDNAAGVVLRAIERIRRLQLTTGARAGSRLTLALWSTHRAGAASPPRQERLSVNDCFPERRLDRGRTTFRAARVPS